MAKTPRALVIRAAGTNCDAELCRAFTLAGAEAELVHLDALIEEPGRVERAQILGFPGGFSFGDDIASGRVFAMKCREKLYPALRAAVRRGCPVIGVCNGFQVLVQVGLLPGPEIAGDWPADRAPDQTVTLTDNSDARFHDRWVPVRYEQGSVCLWTQGLHGEKVEDMEPSARADMMQLPAAHGEGRFVGASQDVLERLERGGQIAVRYMDNYNGSQRAIAGICDATGRVFGLMPHPEFLDWNRHPYWTRLDAGLKKGETPGLRMFRNAVDAAREV